MIGGDAMHFFQYKEGQLHCEKLSIQEIAEEVGTPTRDSQAN